MKKIFAFLLAVLTAASLLACQKEETQAPAPQSDLLLGFARAKITPENSVPLNGCGDSSQRMSTEVLDDLYLTCLAMSDGDQTVLLYSQDLHSTTAALTPTLRTEIFGAVHVPTSNIFIAATGNCSGPDVKSGDDGIQQYLPAYKQAFITTAQEAIADMAPTTLSCAATEVEGLSFVHHYTMADGTVEDGNYGFFDREITGHAAEAYTTMGLVKAQRDGKPAVLMVNWQCTPTLNGGPDKTVISADFVGHLRDRIEEESGMKAVYFTGAYADLSPTSRIPSENHGLDAQAYGQRLADIALEATADMTALEGDSIGVYSVNKSCEVNTEDVHRVDLARKVISTRKTKGDLATDKQAKKLGFRSVYHAASVPSQVNRVKQYSFELSSFRFGDLGFMMSPSPMFGANGEAIRTQCPVGFSLLLCQANGAWNTLPSEAAFDYGGYEADTSYFARGSAERVGEILNEMLLMTTD